MTEIDVLLVSRCAWTMFNFRQGLIRSLLAAGQRVATAGAGGDGFEGLVEGLGVPFIRLPIDRRALNPWSDMKLLGRLHGLYRSMRPRVVHHFTIKPVIYGCLAARQAGLPCIVNTMTGLGFVFTDEGRAGLRRLVELQYRIALRGAHHTFFQNHDDQELFVQRRLAPLEKTSLLPGSGVDTVRFSPIPVTHEGVTFLMLSRLLRDKGVGEFVEAARRVRRQYPEVVFQLVGARDERNPTAVSAAEVQRWQDEGTVRWQGEVQDVRPILAAADVVVLPSYREGMPRALLEAAAMGKPVITTDAVGCREVVDPGVTGLLVPVRDHQGLASAMLHLLEQPELRVRMGAAGRERMVREFDERLVLGNVHAVYRTLGGLAL